MFFAWEIAVALAILVQQCAGQSIVASTNYERISVESDSWTDITAHTLPG